MKSAEQIATEVMDNWSTPVGSSHQKDIHSQLVAAVNIARTERVTVRSSDVEWALRVLNRGSSSLGDYREALKALVGWAE